MIGKTNCKAAQEQPCEKVNINIQSDSASFPGATFTVSYGSYSKTYTWTGSVMTIDIPAYVEYTISFGAVADFTAPASITNTAQAGNSRTVDVTYTLAVEKLTVKVSGITSGYTVTVVNATTGATIGTQTTASKTYNIPAGTKYYVKGSSVSGYISPSNSSTYTAVLGYTRSVSMKYTAHAGTLSPSNGVYIQDTDGYFHTESEWDGSYTPNGVAVITSNCRFVMALKRVNGSYAWGGYGEDIVTEGKDAFECERDYDGETKTTTIINTLKGVTDSKGIVGAPAAEKCRTYTFPNGKKGYLGTAGEWYQALNNRTALESALAKCGGDAMSDSDDTRLYWTSTESVDDLYAWLADIIPNSDQYNKATTAKYSKCNVRPFCSI